MPLDVVEGEAPGPEPPPSRRPGKRRRRLRWVVASAVLLAMVGTYLAAAVALRRQALQFGADGEAIAALLTDYAAALKQRSPDALRATLDAQFHTDDRFGWRRRRVSVENGISYFKLQRGSGPSGGADAEVAATMAAMHGWSRLDGVTVKLLEFTRGTFDGSAKRARVRFWIDGRRSGLGRTQVRGVFDMGFHREGGSWKIVERALSSGEMVAASPSLATFRDVARQRGLDLPEWRAIESQDASNYLNQQVTGHVATGDYDNDGWTDIFITTPRDTQLKLFRNVRGRFVDVTEAAGLHLDATWRTTCILLFDYDNDGYLDLFVGRQDNQSRLFHNNRDGTFTDVTAGSGLENCGPTPMMACAGDYDRDGRLDLYVVNWHDLRTRLDDPFFSDNGPGNHLYHNLGGGRFQDVTRAAGLVRADHSNVCGFVDANADGWPDLFVGNDFGINHLYINQHDGTFRDEAFQDGIRDVGNFMGFDVADTQARGMLDLYATKIDSNTQWIWKEAMNLQVTANLLHPLTALEVLARNLRLRLALGGYGKSGDTRYQGKLKMDGDSLYRATAPGRFQRVDNGATEAHWAWAGLFLDYDNDGYPDLYVANGWISGKIHDDL